MRTTIDSYTARAGRLNLEGIEFDDFKDQPLTPEALRTLRYMHDMEHHTICYLRDLLLTPAHRTRRSPRSSPAGPSRRCGTARPSARCSRPMARRPAPLASPRCGERRRRKQALSTFSTIGSAAFAGRAFIALHMTWGAINEWTTQAGYGRLSESGRPPDAARALGADHETRGWPHRLLRLRSRPSAGREPEGPEADPLRPQAPVAAGRLGGDAEVRGRLHGAIPLRRSTRQRRGEAHRPSG